MDDVDNKDIEDDLRRILEAFTTTALVAQDASEASKQYPPSFSPAELRAQQEFDGIFDKYFEADSNTRGGYRLKGEYTDEQFKKLDKLQYNVDIHTKLINANVNDYVKKYFIYVNTYGAPTFIAKGGRRRKTRKNRRNKDRNNKKKTKRGRKTRRYKKHKKRRTMR